MDRKPIRFPRRLDQNGLYHSVCLTCFQTIAISSSDAVLTEKEWLHKCDGGSALLDTDHGVALKLS
jgi:hypothetical protein